MARGVGRFTAVLSILLLLAAGCSRPAGDQSDTSAPGGVQGEQEPRRGGILRIVDEPPNGPFGVPWEIVATGIVAGIPVFEPLLWMHWQGELHPKLAERWEADPDNKTITLYLRQGVKFHDGTDFNAEAVRYNLEKVIAKGLVPILDSVTVVDPYTVRLNLTAWDNSVFLYLAGTQSVMASPSAMEEKGLEWARDHPVGTGPFQFVSYERDERATYSRFDDYWNEGQPYLDGIELLFIRDPQTLRAAWFNKEVDVVGTSEQQLASELIATGSPHIQDMSGMSIRVMIPDSANPNSPLADKRVRQAISYAIDREALVEARGFGLAEPWFQLAFPGTKAYLEDGVEGGYDPDRARQLLAEAGYPGGFTTRLIAPPFVDRDMVVAIQHQLEQVGIRADTEFPDPARYREYQTGGWNGILIQPWAYFGNYNRWIQFELIGGPEAFVSLKRPPGLEPLWEESRATPSEDAQKVQQLHRLLLDDVTVIPTIRSSRFYITQDYVHDTHHMEWVAWPWWTPGEAWISK